MLWRSGSLSHFKCRFAGIFVFIWRFTVQKLLAVSVLMQKVKKTKEVWSFAECTNPYNRPS